MARPERPLDPGAGPVQSFAAELRHLREQAGHPKYLQMSRRTAKSRTALAEAAGGDHLPTWETVDAYVRACGGDPAAWLPRWEQARDAVHEQRNTSGRPPADRRSAEAQSVDGGRASTEVLLHMWREQRDQARQSENQRAVLTGCFLACAGAAAGFTLQHGHDPKLLMITIPLVALGVIGTVASMKYYERFQMHMTEAQSLRRRLDELHPQLEIEGDWHRSRTEHGSRYTRLYHVRLHHLWTSANVAVAVVGVLLTLFMAW